MKDSALRAVRLRKLAWSKVWDKFNVIVDREEAKRKCQSCGCGTIDSLEWADQQKIIQRLVNAELAK